MTRKSVGVKLTGILCFLILIWHFSFSVEAGILPSSFSTGGGYKSIIYNSQNGLPTSEANAIVQTEDGYIWIGSYSGLIRYDGVQFDRYDSSYGISSVTELFVDSLGRLWIGSNDEGIILYTNDGTFQFFQTEDGETLASVKKIIEDSDGNIIIGTTSGVAYVDQTLSLHVIQNSSLEDSYIQDLDTDQDGQVIGITNSGKIFKLSNLKNVSMYESTFLESGTAKSVFFDHDTNDIYIGTDGEYLYKTSDLEDITKYQKCTTDLLEGINRIYKDCNDNIWVCADNGIGYVEATGMCCKIDGLDMDSSIDDMMMDYEGSLWFASSRQGIMEIVVDKFSDISAKADMGNHVVNATQIYQENLYVGTDDGLYVLNRQYKMIQNDLTSMLSSERIRCIYKDSKNNLWICSYGDMGLIEYQSDGTIISYTEETGLVYNKTRMAIELDNGDIAVATNHGISIIRNGEVIENYGKAEGLENTEILSLCEGPDHSIYAGSDGGGLYQITEGHVVAHFDKENGLKSNVIIQIKKDPIRNVYWIITGNSIVCLEDDQVRNINSFTYSNNFDVFWNQEDEAWIISSNGIYVVDGEQLYQDKVQIQKFWNFDNGMPSSVTANSKSFQTDDGMLYLGGVSSVFSIDTNDDTDYQIDKKIAISHVILDGEEVYVDPDEKLLISSTCKRIIMNADVLSYNLDDIKIQYYLEGFDDEIETVTKEELTDVSYTNLPGGDYIFHVIVKDNNTGQTVNELQFNLTKKRSFFESTWFLIFIGLLVIVFTLFIFLFASWYKNKKLKKEEGRRRLLINQIVGAFAKLIDGKDKYTNGHSFRVAEYSALIATRMGYDDSEIENIHNIALLHDIGKISVPDSILNKKERLTDDEYLTIKKHTEFGYEVLKEITVYPEISLGARFHHERIDGKGYPLALSGEEIPMIAKIIAVADTFDAMYSTRSYRKQMPIEQVVNDMKNVEGKQLDRNIVEILIQLIKDGEIE